MTALIALEGVSKSFGSVRATDQFSMELEEGEALGVIGPNGAGKSTMFNIITGGVRPNEGRVLFAGRDITRTPAHERCRMGIGRSYQIPHPFANMTVFENLELGGFLLYRSQGKKALLAEIERMYAIFPKLSERKTQYAGTLSGGEQQMLAIAMALMARPRLLLLDEPSMGLAPLIVKEIFRIVERLQIGRAHV